MVVAVLLAFACVGDGGKDAPETPAYVVPATEATGETPAGGRRPPDGAAAGPHGFTFTEVAREAGIDFVHENGAFGAVWLPETMGSGGAFFDYDGDPWPDVLLVNFAPWPGHEADGPPPTLRLYRNRRDGTFEDVTRRAGLALTMQGMGVAAADYDADGDTDLYLTALGPDRLLRNDEGRFVDVTEASGALRRDDPARGAWTAPAIWFDPDRDGWPDLYVCSYVKWTPEADVFGSYDGVTKAYAPPDAYDSDSCRYLYNEGDGTFEDRTAWAGLKENTGKSLGIATEDLNDDGWPDLVIANDRVRNFVYLNQGDGTFVEDGVARGLAYDENGLTRSGMGIDIVRPGPDGVPVVAIGNFSEEPVSLFTRVAGDVYIDRGAAAGLAGPTLPTLTFGLLFSDFDLDGSLDLLLANGHLESSINEVMPDITFEQPPQLFLGDPAGGFADAAGTVGPDFEEPVVGRGLAVADYDLDGDVDVLLTTNGGRARLYRNDRDAPARWIRVRLRGAHPNLDALGAVVTVFAGGRAQTRLVRTGGSYLSQSVANPMLFGLGGAERADSVLVRWPGSGAIRREGPVAAGETLVVREGGGG